MDTAPWRDQEIAKVAPQSGIVSAVGDAVMDAEQATVAMSTNRLYRLRMRHPLLYGIIAFVIGGGVVALFTMSTYSNWAYQSIDLKVALYQVVLGGLGGGIVLTALAFMYAHTVGETVVRRHRAVVDTK